MPLARDRDESRNRLTHVVADTQKMEMYENLIRATRNEAVDRRVEIGFCELHVGVFDDPARACATELLR